MRPEGIKFQRPWGFAELSLVWTEVSSLVNQTNFLTWLVVRQDEPRKLLAAAGRYFACKVKYNSFMALLRKWKIWETLIQTFHWAQGWPKSGLSIALGYHEEPLPHPLATEGAAGARTGPAWHISWFGTSLFFPLSLLQMLILGSCLAPQSSFSSPQSRL